MDSGGSTTRAGIYAMFHPYLVVTVGELRPTDPHGICIYIGMEVCMNAILVVAHAMHT